MRILGVALAGALEVIVVASEVTGGADFEEDLIIEGEDLTTGAASTTVDREGVSAEIVVAEVSEVNFCLKALVFKDYEITVI